MPPTELEAPDTEVISVAAPAPVFVDSTGRRSRLLRRLSYAFGALVMLYGGLISISLAGGPVRSHSVLPLPGLEPATEGKRVSLRPSIGPQPRPATTNFITEALPRHTSTQPTNAPRLDPAKPTSQPTATTPAAAPTPKPTATPIKATDSSSKAPTVTPTTVPTTISTPILLPHNPPVLVPTGIAPAPPTPGVGAKKVGGA